MNNAGLDEKGSGYMANRTAARLRWIVGAAPIALIVGAPAMAQDNPNVSGVPNQTTNAEGEEGARDIIVTGSRIQRTDLTSTSPVSVVPQEEFRLSGAVNVEQVVNTLPQVLPGVTGFSNNPGNGATTLNLRNLGTTRTLVLVNGRRWMFFDTNQIVDLNTIPQFLLDGVDVVTGGASAVYGSDAVAGVVNFRLRKVEGVEIGGNYSITERGDGARYDANFALGTSLADGRGNVTLFANYTRRQSIFASARSFSRQVAQDGCIVPGSTNPDNGLGTPRLPITTIANCSAAGGEVGLYQGGSPNGNIATIGITSTRSIIFNPTGGGSRDFVDPFDLYNFGPDNYLQLPQERYLIGAYGNYEVSDNLELYSELTFASSTVAQELAPTPTGVPAALQIASPFFNDQTRSTLALIADPANPGFTTATTVQFRFTQAGARNQEDTRQSFRTLFGARGDITENLRYDAYYFFSRTRNSRLQTGNIVRSRLINALQTDFAPDGTVRCRDAGARAQGCVPLNAFGLNQASQASLNYLTVGSNVIFQSDIQNAVASVSGELFNFGLGAEDVGFAVGGEYRKLSSRFVPDALLSSGDVLGFNAGTPTRGSYDVKEVFGEIRVPILKDNLFSSLEVNGAVRYSDYSLGNVGGVWTYAGGVDFAPVEDVRLRGQYQRSVRAPNVEDLFAGQSTGFPAVTDPCSDRGQPAQRTETLRALCIASGVPAAAVFTRGVQPAAQIQADFGGNPNVGEETSDTYTFGVVYRPSFIPRLNITVDYFDIKVKDTISTFAGGLGNALSLCFTVVQNLSDPVCSIFPGRRNPQTGALGQTAGGTNPPVLSANIGELSTSGVDLQVDYNMPLAFSLFGEAESRVSFFYLATFLDTFRSFSVQSIRERETIAEGTLLQASNPLPKYRHTARVSFSDGPAQISLRWRHNGAVNDSRLNNTFNGLVRIPQDPGTLPNARVKSINYFDLSTSIDVNDRLNFTFGVNNLFDKLPEVLGSLAEQANTYPGFYDPLGRDFFVSARMRF